MKRTLTIIALLMISVLAFAQRTDYCTVKADSKNYEVFSYKGEGGSLGYYLGLDTPDNLVSGELTEVCVYLGADAVEAQRTLNSLVKLADATPDTVQEFQGRVAHGDQLKDSGLLKAKIEKKSNSPKQIYFYYDHGANMLESSFTKKAATTISTAAKGALK
jgi:hypothetical protein